MSPLGAYGKTVRNAAHFPFIFCFLFEYTNTFRNDFPDFSIRHSV